ncbi:endonuclease V [Candidatus Thorarchaeota archaeon]|nr:MAG: endonuclease V [Candidatus Thorarchaeota archaeon]
MTSLTKEVQLRRERNPWSPAGPLTRSEGKNEHRLEESQMQEALDESEKTQRLLASRVVTQDQFDEQGGFVTGVDVAYSDDRAFGCAIVMHLEELRIVRRERVVTQVESPYFAGHFYLREGPVLKHLLSEIAHPGLVMVDGNGVLHPRRCGLASHIGVELDIPTIGVAKSLHLGELERRRGNRANIVEEEELLGCALWLDKRKKPVYVSVGHRVSLESATAIVERSSVHGRPEPLRVADICSRDLSKEA